MTRARRTLLITALLLASFPAAAARDPHPMLRGPIADFWNQVRRQWARKIPGLQSGPGQTGQWVSLVYGAEGEDEALAELVGREMRVWAKWQRRNWVRSEFWKKRYDRLDRASFYGSRALRQNLVVIGTPSSNPMVTRMTAGTPFDVEGDVVRIGNREYLGASLVLVFIRPNPFGGGNYSLVIAATGEEALLDLQRMPIGRTDYVLFRGAHPLESGFLDWSNPDDLWLTGQREVRPDHEGWWAVGEGALTVRFHPAEVSEEDANAFARRRAADLRTLTAFFGGGEPLGMDTFLYGSAGSKVRHTGEPGWVTVDLAGGAVHRVHRPGMDDVAWPEAMVVAWRAWGPTDLRGLLLGLALLPGGAFEGQPLDAWASRLASRGRLKPVEDLMVPGPPWRHGEGDSAPQALALASFLAGLEERHGLAALEEFYRRARSTGFRGAFREALGVSLGAAERAWRGGLPPPPTGAAPAVSRPDAAERPQVSALLAGAETLFRRRRDAAAAGRLREALALDPDLAEAHLLLARLAFRGGRDDEAAVEAAEALRLGAGDAEIAAWARVTLGRAHAARGAIQSARLELTDPAVERGPEGPRLLAEFWLENLGLSPNRRAAAAYLAEQAEIDLLSYEWDAAERRALQILAADPGDPAAHHLLARIRLEKFSYWFDFSSLYNELFPGTTPSDPMQYYHLVQSSHRESLKGAYLESGEVSSLDLDRRKSRKLESEWIPDRLYPAMREPDHMSAMSEEVLRGRAFLLAGDYGRAASHLRSALQLVIPVSDARAWTLYLLAQAENKIGETAAARVHLQEALAMVRKKSLRADIEGELASLGN